MRDPEAASEAKEHQESRREESQEEVMAGQIQAWLDRSITDMFEEGQPDKFRTMTCTQEIWEECLGRTGTVGRFDQTVIGKAMALLPGWSKTKGAIGTGPVADKYGKVRMYVKKTAD